MVEGLLKDMYGSGMYGEAAGGSFDWKLIGGMVLVAAVWWVVLYGWKGLR